jgi:hypothetical protein
MSAAGKEQEEEVHQQIENFNEYLSLKNGKGMRTMINIDEARAAK